MALVQVGKTSLLTATSALAVMRGFKSTGYLSKVIKGVLTAVRLHFYSVQKSGAWRSTVMSAVRACFSELRGATGTGEDKANFFKTSGYINTCFKKETD